MGSTLLRVGLRSAASAGALLAFRSRHCSAEEARSELASAVDNKLLALYESLPNIHQIPIGEQQQIDDSGGHEAYGELTPDGVRAVMARLQPAPGDVVCDLGSGCARMLLQLALEWPELRSIGVELSPARHAVGREALQRCEFGVQGKVELLQEDMLRPKSEGSKRALEDASHIYVVRLPSVSAHPLVDLPQAASHIYVVRLPSVRAHPLVYLPQARVLFCRIYSLT